MTRQAERDYIRRLAGRYMETAQSPENLARRDRWRKVYALQKPDRMPVLCRGAGSFFVPGSPADNSGFSPPDHLRCAEPLHLEMERAFKANLVHYALNDDKPLYPYWRVTLPVEDYEMFWGVQVHTMEKDGTLSRNYYTDQPVKDEEDLKKLCVPDIVSYISEKKKVLDKKTCAYADILDDIMPVKLAVEYWHCLGHLAARLMGMQEMMMNMHLQPDFVHRLMKFLSGGCVAMLDKMDAMSVWIEESHCHDWYLIPQSEPGDAGLFQPPIKAHDLWGRAESQNHDLIGPDMTYEFLVQYQIPVLKRFKLVSYGCCENLTNKWDQVFAIPNLRLVVNSPWTDIRKTVEKCKDKYCIIYRPHWDPVIHARDDKELQWHIESEMATMQGCYRAIVFEDLAGYLSAAEKTPGARQNLIKAWIRIAKETVSKYN